MPASNFEVVSAALARASDLGRITLRFPSVWSIRFSSVLQFAFGFAFAFGYRFSTLGDPFCFDLFSRMRFESRLAMLVGLRGLGRITLRLPSVWGIPSASALHLAFGFAFAFGFGFQCLAPRFT